MEDGKEVILKFPEFDIEFPVRVRKTEKDRYISYYWDLDNTELLVEMTLTPRGSGATLVTVTEKGMSNDPEGIKWL